MTTEVKRFIKLLERFSVVYDNDGNDTIEYILKNAKEFDMPKMFDNKGDKVLCELCNHQLYYDNGDTRCFNENCNIQEDTN